MKKITSVVLMLLAFFSNFFCYSFAQESAENPVGSPELTGLQEEFQQENEDKIGDKNEEISEKGVLKTEKSEENLVNEKEERGESEELETQKIQGIVEEGTKISGFTVPLDSYGTDLQIYSTFDTQTQSNEPSEIANTDSGYSCDSCIQLGEDIYCDANDEDCFYFCWACEDAEDSGTIIISEIYFDGSYEWIEIYNNLGYDFSGDLNMKINGKDYELENFFIQSGGIAVFADNKVDTISDTSSVIFLKDAINMTDTKAINISISQGWTEFDSVSIAESIVKDLNDLKTSFHRFIDLSGMVATTSSYLQNNIGSTSNPGCVYWIDGSYSCKGPGTPAIQDIDEPEETGNKVPIPSLKITEIYNGLSGSRFEITNIGDENFSGDLILNGNLNLTISTEIPVGISKVFANNLVMFQSGNGVELLENSISFTNGEINIDLIRSGEVLDTFFVHESRVNYSKGFNSSFEKVGSGDNRTTTYVGLSDRRFNTNRGIVANPTKYFITGENLIDVTKEKVNYDTLTVPVDCSTKKSGIEISEVFVGNSAYPSYIELLQRNDVLEDYIFLLITGSALKQSVLFDTENLSQDRYILLSESDTWYRNDRNSAWNTDMKLNNSGWIMLYGISSEDRNDYEDEYSCDCEDWDDFENCGDDDECRDCFDYCYDEGNDGSDTEYFTFDADLLDVILLGKTSNGNSTYRSTNKIQCAEVFNNIKKFSPGLTRGQSEFIQITPDPIIQYIQVGGGGGSCSNDETPTFDSSSFSSSEIQISAIKYYRNKQILKLKNKTNSDVNLHDYYLQFLDGSTKNIQGNTLFAKSTMSFVGNYGLQTNQDFCVNLMKDGEVVDRYCRNSLTKATAQDEQNISNQLTFREELDDNEELIINNEELEEEENENQNNTGNNGNLLQTNLIKIIDIDYDPAGADGDNESVTLLLLTGNYIDLSGYNFYYTKDGKTQKAKAQIQGILSYGIRQTFKGGFAFPNSTDDKKPVTVNLIGPDGKVVDTYIYNPNKITEIPAGDYEVLSVIDGDTIKINYDSQEFTIRFAGIDAPESSALRCGKVECFGPEAKQYLKSLIEGKTISFEPASLDGYDRFVGYIYLGGENINEKLIKNGYAREYSYKNQSYKYQSQFKSAQDYARNNSLGLRGYECKGERLCPVDETQSEYKFVFNIENIIYNPDGNDNGNEEIWIKMIEGVTTEFGTDFYLLVNDTKKSLKKYGSISPQETKKLVGTFGFPNNKLTTVSLVYNGEILDTYVYNPELDKLVDTGSTLSTGDELLAQISQFQILSILPNPFGADGSNEEIELFCKSELPNLNLSSGFYLQIGTTKKYLKGEISTNESVNLKGAFSFPNKGGCVELGYKGFIFDKFCYTQPDEGQKFQISNGVIESISTLDLSILKNSKLQNIGNKVCLTYAGQTFSCKNMPYSKLSTKKISQNKMYKSFFDSFEDYMKDNWKIMYYDSEIKNYFELLDEIEDVISSGGTTITLDGINYDISQFQEIYESRYKKTPSKIFSDTLRSLVSDEIVNKYEKLKSEYLEILENN